MTDNPGNGGEDRITRLRKEDLERLAEGLGDYDRELRRKTGLTLRQIACEAAGIPEDAFRRAAMEYRVAAIPMTCGQGVIPLFAQSVQSIVAHLGFPAFVTCRTDVDGIAEGIEQGAGILFLADDNRFIALNVREGTVADNNIATARGFVSALNAMAGGLKGKGVLVLGLGPVGRASIAYLKELEAKIGVYDINPSMLDVLRQEPGIIIEEDLDNALAGYSCIIDATPAAGFIRPERLRAGAMLAMPGIPLGLAPGGPADLLERVIHDPLQIGVAAMLAMAVKQ